MFDLLEPEHVVTLKMKRLSETSHGIREKIWYDLQVQRSKESNRVECVFFSSKNETPH